MENAIPDDMDFDPTNRTGLGQCQQIPNGDWGPKLESWQHPIFGIEMFLVALLLIKQRVFSWSGDYLQLDVIDIFDRVLSRSQRLSWQQFNGVKRTLTCVIFFVLFVSWAFGRFTGLLVPTVPDVFFGINGTAFLHPKELRPKDVFPTNSWATAILLFFVHFASPGISEAVFFHALQMSLPAWRRSLQVPLLASEAEEVAERKHEVPRVSSWGCCRKRKDKVEQSADSPQSSVAQTGLSSAGAAVTIPSQIRKTDYANDMQAALRQHGASRPPLLEYLLSFTVYLLFHLDMFHSNPIARNKQYLVIAMGIWVVCQELVIFTQSIWPAAVLRWIAVWTWVVFFGGGCYYWQGMFAGVGA